MYVKPYQYISINITVPADKILFTPLLNVFQSPNEQVLLTNWSICFQILGISENGGFQTMFHGTHMFSMIPSPFSPPLGSY